MRSLTCLLATILLACIGPQVLVVAQEEGPCPNNDTELPSQLGGRHLPAYDTVRVLVVFIDFPDDDESPADTAWPVGSGPTFKNTIVYQNPASATSGSMTHFFEEMSFGYFHFVGEAVYKQARYPLSTYIEHPTWTNDVPRWAVTHVLESLDSTMDFGIYDKWRKDAPYQHTKAPDGNVDMVIAAYRRLYDDAEGFSNLGWAALARYPSDSLYITVDNGARKVYLDWKGVGSGLSVCTRYRDQFLWLAGHEFGHYWGLIENYAGGSWSLMSYWDPNVSNFMNSYERVQLAFPCTRTRLPPERVRRIKKESRNCQMDFLPDSNSSRTIRTRSTQQQRSAMHCQRELW